MRNHELEPLHKYKDKGIKSPGFFFNWVPRHESVLGEWSYSPTHSWPCY